MASLAYLDPITYHVGMTVSTKLLPVSLVTPVNLDIKDPLERPDVLVSREKTISRKAVKAALDKTERLVSKVKGD